MTSNKANESQKDRDGFQFDYETVSWVTAEFIADPPPSTPRYIAYLILATLITLTVIASKSTFPNTISAKGQITQKMIPKTSAPILATKVDNANDTKLFVAELFVSNHEISSVRIGMPVHIKTTSGSKKWGSYMRGNVISISASTVQGCESQNSQLPTPFKIISSIDEFDSIEALHPTMAVSASILIADQSLLKMLRNIVLNEN